MSSLQSDDPDHEIERILLAGFQVAAEKLSLDDAAWGRTSQRMRRLNDQIERDYARSRGTFREHSWSFVKDSQRKFSPAQAWVLGMMMFARRVAPGQYSWDITSAITISLSSQVRTRRIAACRRQALAGMRSHESRSELGNDIAAIARWNEATRWLKYRPARGVPSAHCKENDRR
jgi:hypothetical protein